MARPVNITCRSAPQTQGPLPGFTHWRRVWPVIGCLPASRRLPQAPTVTLFSQRGQARRAYPQILQVLSPPIGFRTAALFRTLGHPATSRQERIHHHLRPCQQCHASGLSRNRLSVSAMHGPVSSHAFLTLGFQVTCCRFAGSYHAFGLGAYVRAKVSFWCAERFGMCSRNRRLFVKIWTFETPKCRVVEQASQDEGASVCVCSERPSIVIETRPTASPVVPLQSSMHLCNRGISSAARSSSSSWGPI